MDRLRRVEDAEQGVDKLLVTGLREPVAGRGGRQPDDAVHFGVGREVAFGRLRGPVAHLFGTALRQVAGRGEPGAGGAAVACLLLDLAQGAVEGALGSLQLALGVRPVVV